MCVYMYVYVHTTCGYMYVLRLKIFMLYKMLNNTAQVILFLLYHYDAHIMYCFSLIITSYSIEMFLLVMIDIIIPRNILTFPPGISYILRDIV